MTVVRLFVQANPMVYVSQGGKFWVKTEQEGWQAQTPSATYGLDPMFLGDGTASRKYRQALQAVLQDQGHIYKRCAYTFRDDLPGDTFNLMDTSDWLDPEDGQHHVAFDILMASLCNGDEEAIDHIKRVVAWKRVNPEDSYTLPCCVHTGRQSALQPVCPADDYHIGRQDTQEVQRHHPGDDRSGVQREGAG